LFSFDPKLDLLECYGYTMTSNFAVKYDRKTQNERLHMIPGTKFLSKLTIIISPICLMAGIVPASATVVWSENFNTGIPSSLAVAGGSTGSSVSPVSGQLQIYSTGPFATYVVANTSIFGAPYSSILKDNSGTVTWAFNVSNQDGQNNNFFFFCLASDSTDPLNSVHSSYVFQGGGGVGNIMEIDGVGSAFPSPYLLQIPSANGLGPLPSMGSFRITYDPSTDLWSVYGEIGSSYVDPTTVTTLLGSFVDSTYTSIPLQYMAFGGGDTGYDYFDNVSVSVAPEPTVTTLAVLGIAVGITWKSKRSASKAAN
jgi:hypothetical protein